MKICGLTSEADAGLLIKYGADYGGVVVFYPKSKRDVTIKYRKQVLIIFKFTAHLKRLYMRQTQFRL